MGTVGKYLTAIRTVALLLVCGVARADALSDIRTLRSLSAEAAEIIRLHAQHRVTDTYATRMKQEAREEIQSAAKSADAPQLKAMAQQALEALGHDDAKALSQLAQQLFAMEGPHGRAD